MCCVVEPGRSVRWYHLIVLATISVAAAGCSADSQRFNSNPFQSDASASTGAATGSPAQRRSMVQAKPLPAPRGAAAMGGADAKPTATPGAAARSSASAAGKQTASAASGNVVHVVARGDTLMKLSRKYHKPLGEIAKANNIPANTMVRIGDRIVIPGAHGSHAIAARTPAAPASENAPKLLPKQAAKPAPERKVANSTPEHQTAPAPAASTAAVLTPVAHRPEPEKTKREVAAATPSFRWPVRGRVISAFGPRPTGQQNDGINVSVPEGTPIKAAEDGVVAYAGNELKSYGNLVLIRHESGYVTAYAHAGEILVKRDDPIKRGQVIARAGQSGSVAAPQLHFEIRKGSTPVDPLPLLDKSGAT
jgi:murein DD-endopeptidase MepM/ murein hydrolase activator NlpD